MIQSCPPTAIFLNSGRRNKTCMSMHNSHVTSLDQLQAWKSSQKSRKNLKRSNISKNDNSKLSSNRHFSQLLQDKQHSRDLCRSVTSLKSLWQVKVTLEI